MGDEVPHYDVAIVGGGPSGATAAYDLARKGVRCVLIERGFRIKPCGGAIPPCLIKEFDIPEHLLVARVNTARMISPAEQRVDMTIGGFVGMVDRAEFDPWLRERAREAGVKIVNGAFKGLAYSESGTVVLRYQDKVSNAVESVSAKAVIGADGANSAVARAVLPPAARSPYVMAYHEIIESPGQTQHYDPLRADVFYQGELSPDFYAWIFPHGEHASVGVGTAVKSFSMTDAVSLLRERTGLDSVRTIRKEGAPIPLKPLKRWDDGKRVVLTGDAAGVVAPASGEGIYYAMLCGRMVADAVEAFLHSGDATRLRLARKNFMRLHGRVFWVLGLLQRYWYGTDKRREKFVQMCRDPDVQYLTWESYMHKKLVRRKPLAHVRVFFKDLVQLLGLSSA